MENFNKSKRNFKLPNKQELNAVFSYFSKKEWIIFLVSTFVLVLTTLLILNTINRSFMVEVPMYGGSLSEGIIGTPRFINPVLGFSDVDRDLSSLVYLGLMHKNSKGSLEPGLAEKYEISEDNLVYTFTLKENIYFQDNTPITADDVVFTIDTVKDSVIKSPYKANWDGVSVEKIDDRTITFTLKQPYGAFLENTTFGIMPKHIWGGTPIELNNFNTSPIGSGPYMINKTIKQSSGVITSYEFKAFDKFVLGKPFVKYINIHFYQNEDELVKALKSKEVDQINSITPLGAVSLEDDKFRIESSVLPRIFGLFFNQNQNQLFVDKSVVKAIDLAIDKERIINEVLSGYGVVIDDPIPPSMTAYQKMTNSTPNTREETNKKIDELLTKDGWTKNGEGLLEKKTGTKNKTTTTLLSFSIATGNAPELVRAAELIKQDLEQFGMVIDVKTFETGNLNQNVIRPRKYDALLFGEIINHEFDLFAFWHSSQRKDPGLNVAMYTNVKVDKILEDAFTTTDEDIKAKKYAEFENEIAKDMPAVFLYSPDFIYIVSKDLQGLDIKNITSPGDRFLDIHKWYTKTDNVWKVFAN